MTQLYLLGPTEIRKETGELDHSFLAGPKRLALLSYLLLQKPRGYQRRDNLLPLFWPDQDQKSARNALSNMLYHIRKTLGKQAICNRGVEEISINTEVFWCDVLEFEIAVKEKNYKAAVDLYRSQLLRGFYVQDISAEFDLWLEKQRNRFSSLGLESCQKEAMRAVSKEDTTSAIEYLKKACQIDPYSEEIHLDLLQLLFETGRQKEALDLYESFSRLMQLEFGEGPGNSMKKLWEEIKHHSHISFKAAPGTKSSVSKSPSIAVLAFETLGKRKPTAFTDALHSDILTRLSHISHLFVISRNSVLRCKPAFKTLKELAGELKVEWILTGEVQEIEGMVNVNVRLVEVATERQVWAESYLKKLNAGNIFNIQAEITTEVTNNLKTQLSPAEKRAIHIVPTTDLQAFYLYSLGRNCLDQRTKSSLLQGLNYFKDAIEADEGYALAWSGLSDTLSLLKYYNYPIPSNSPEALEAADKAVNLNRDLGETWTSMGIAYSIDHKGPAALSSLEKAISLAPGYAEAQIWLGWLYLSLDRPKEALRPALQASRLNPLNPAIKVFLAEIYLCNGFYGEAYMEAVRGREINPDYGLAHFIEGLVLFHKGSFKKAAQVLERSMEIIQPQGTPNLVDVKTCLAYTYFALGNKEYGKILMEELREPEEKHILSLAMLQVLYEELDKAFFNLDKIQFWSAFSTEQLRYFYPRELASLRKDERFKELQNKLNSNWGLN